MSLEGDSTSRRIPTLVQYCQRVASVHVDSIQSLGEASYELVRPVLQYCAVETLLRIEENSPHLEEETNDLWKAQCFRAYPLATEQHIATAGDSPSSWKQVFFFLRDQEAKRFEAIGSRIRNQRLEAEERKKESQIKLTDKVPPAKRARGWNGPTQPKSLFQKTRSEASKIQKTMFGPQMRPAMFTAKSYCVKNTVSAKPPPPATVSSNPRVVVKTVAYRRPVMSKPAMSKPASPAKPSPPETKPSKDTENVPKVAQMPSPATPITSDSRPRPPKAPVAAKKSGASLFMPKHRQHSQLPSQPLSRVTRAA